MKYRINVQIRNQYGETEDETTVYAATYAAVCRKAWRWMGRSLRGATVEKSRIGAASWWIVR